MAWHFTAFVNYPLVLGFPSMLEQLYLFSVTLS